MAKLSKKAKEVETVVEETNVEYVAPEDVESEMPMTMAEKEVIKETEERQAEESADIQRLQLATNLVSNKFNLDPSYSVKKFEDKGKVVNLTLENNEFIINVTIKDSDRHGMYIEFGH